MIKTRWLCEECYAAKGAKVDLCDKRPFFKQDKKTQAWYCSSCKHRPGAHHFTGLGDVERKVKELQASGNFTESKQE